MQYNAFPVIDPIATGKNILYLRKEKGLTVGDLQEYFGFEEPQAIYRWQYGKTLPSVDNLYALSAILGVPMNSILVPVSCRNIIQAEKQQGAPAAFSVFASIHEEILVCDADFFFFCGFSHHEDDISLLCIVAEHGFLRIQKELQIAA